MVDLVKASSLLSIPTLGPLSFSQSHLLYSNIFNSESTLPSNETLLGNSGFSQGNNQINSASKRKKKAHPLLLEQSCFKSRGRFPSAAYPLALFGSCLTSQTRYNGRGCGEHDVGEESVGEKTGLLAPFVLFRGQDEKRNTTPSRHGPDAIPSPRRPRTLEDSKQTRLGPEVSGGPRPPGCPEAQARTRVGLGPGMRENQKPAVPELSAGLKS